MFSVRELGNLDTLQKIDPSNPIWQDVALRCYCVIIQILSAKNAGTLRSKVGLRFKSIYLLCIFGELP